MEQTGTAQGLIKRPLMVKMIIFRVVYSLDPVSSCIRIRLGVAVLHMTLSSRGINHMRYFLTSVHSEKTGYLY